MAEATPSRRRKRASGVGPATSEHDAMLAEFYQAAWGGRGTDAATIARQRALEAETNPADPGQEPPKWLFWKDARVIGYLGTIPVEFQIGGVRWPAYWLKGFWVLPEFRGGPVGAAVLDEAVKQLGHCGVSTVAAPARRLFESRGLVDHGLLFNRLLPLDLGKILRAIDLDSESIASLPGAAVTALRGLRSLHLTSLVGAVARAGTSFVTVARGRPAKGVELRSGWRHFTELDLDHAWSRFETPEIACAVRDGRWVSWRYDRSDQYQITGVWEDDRLAAWAVTTAPRESDAGPLAGVVMASVSDLIFPLDRPDLGHALLATVAENGRRLGAEALLCSGSHPALLSALSRRGFLKIPGNVHFMARNDGEHVYEPRLASWWLTRGDAESDGSF